MNSTVRISVRAQFGNTLSQFQNLRKVLASFDTNIAAVNKHLITLSDMFDRNAAHAEAWATKVASAGKRASATTGGMVIGGPGGTRSSTVLPTVPAALGKSLDSTGAKLIDVGKKAQWTGSVMTYAFTVPLAAVLYLGIKANNAYSTSLGQLRQAYNLTGASVTSVAARQKAWLRDGPLLERIILSLSNAYGIQRSEVAATAAELARMGDRQAALGKDLQTVTRMQTTYNITNKQATEIVSQMRSAWGMTADEARNAANQLAAVQELGRGSFDQLAAGINRASQPARALKFTYQELAAMQATLLQQVSPSQGGTQGNSLTAIFARLVAVVPKAKVLLKEFGIEVNGAEWANSTGMQKLQMVADKWNGMTMAQQQAVAVALAGQRQWRALVPIIADLASKQSNIRKIIDETSNATKNEALANHQLAVAMQTPAKNFQLLKVNLQNTFMLIARDLTPALLQLGHILAGAGHWFASLPKGVQQFFLITITVLALVGPVMKLKGAFLTLAGVMIRAVAFVLTALPTMFGPVGAIITILTLVFGAVVAFSGNTQRVFKDLAEALGFIAHAIYQTFSWINPWARHSPSLVDNVSTGVDQMLKDFTRLKGDVTPIMQSIGGVITDTGNAASNLNGGFSTTSLAAARRQLVAAASKHVNIGNSLGTFDKGVSSLNALGAAMKRVGTLYDAQSAKVRRLKDEMDRAGDAQQKAQAKLTHITNQRQLLQDQKAKIGDATALYSQSAALRAEGRQIAAGGNTALADRFAEQANALQKQGQKATSLDSQIASLTVSIDKQKLATDDLTSVHDKLSEAYANENQKLQDLSAGYQEMKAQYTQLQQNLLQMGSSAAGATKALKETASAGSAAGVANAKFRNDTKGSLADLAKQFDKLGNMHGLGKFFQNLKDGWNKGWAEFGHQPGIAKFFEGPLITGLAIAVLMMSKTIRRLFAPLTLAVRNLFRSLLGKEALTSAVATESSVAGGAAAGGGILTGLRGVLRRGLAGGLLALGGITLGNMVDDNKKGSWRNTAGGALKGAGIGAGIGMTIGGPLGALVGAGAGAIIGGLTAWTSAQHVLNKQLQGYVDVMRNDKVVTQAFSDAVVIGGDRLNPYTVAVAKAAIAHTSLTKLAKDTGLTETDLANAVAGSDTEFNRVMNTWIAMHNPGNAVRATMSALHQQFIDGQIAARKYADEHGVAIASEIKHGTELDLMSGKLGNFNQWNLDATSSSHLFHLKLDEMTNSVHKNGTSLDSNSYFGRQNIKSIRDGAVAALGHAQAVYRQTHNLGKADAALQRDKAELIKHATQAGLSKTAVNKLVTAIFNVKSKKVGISVDTAAAYRNVTNFGNWYDWYLTKMGQKNLPKSNPISQVGGNSGIIQFGPSFIETIPPRHAMGGITTRAQMGIIGEAGPEAILPLSASNPFVSMFANTVANRLAMTMGRYASANITPTVQHSTVNSHNKTTNIKIDYRVNAGTATGRIPTSGDFARDLGIMLGSRGLH